MYEYSTDGQAHDAEDLPCRQSRSAEKTRCRLHLSSADDNGPPCGCGEPGCLRGELGSMLMEAWCCTPKTLSLKTSKLLWNFIDDVPEDGTPSS
jgi:hypothetical protein